MMTIAHTNFLPTEQRLTDLLEERAGLRERLVSAETRATMAERQQQALQARGSLRCGMSFSRPTVEQLQLRSGHASLMSGRVLLLRGPMPRRRGLRLRGHQFRQRMTHGKGQS